MTTKRFTIVRWFVVLAILLSVIPMGSVHAAAPDVIGLYKVTIQPQPDGTLQMRYEFTNYCATTDFPSADFYVGMPNSHFSITAAGGDLSGDTGWVTRFSQSGVKAYVNFRDTPRAGQCFNFWYEFHQERMAYLSGEGENVSFQYQPGWFDFATITRLEIWWKLPDQSLVQSLTPEPTKQEGWAIWTYDNMGVNAKTDMLNLLFSKAAFPNLSADTPDQSQSPTSGSPEGGFLGLSCLTWIIIIIVIVLVVMFLAWVIEEGGSGGGGYSGGGGGWSSLGGGGGGSSRSSSGGGWGGSSGRSSGCAGCAGCACACAGGGRAGCAVKGFKLPRVILDKVLQALKRGE